MRRAVRMSCLPRRASPLLERIDATQVARRAIDRNELDAPHRGQQVRPRHGRAGRSASPELSSACGSTSARSTARVTAPAGALVQADLEQAAIPAIAGLRASSMSACDAAPPRRSPGRRPDRRQPDDDRSRVGVGDQTRSSSAAGGLSTVRRSAPRLGPVAERWAPRSPRSSSRPYPARASARAHRRAGPAPCKVRRPAPRYAAIEGQRVRSRAS